MDRMPNFLAAFLALIVFVQIGWGASRLQRVLSQAEPGSRIELPAGIFHGPIVIDKPLILSGKGRESLIEGDGNGSVIKILSSDVTIENLSVSKSGKQRYSLDSGIEIDRAERVAVRGCDIFETLFGIVVSDSRDISILDNNITSYPLKVVDNRGDGIRLWGSHHSRIVGNRLFRSRDLSLNRSDHNRVEGNIVTQSRYGVLLNGCRDLNVSCNRLLSNYVGILCQGGRDLRMERNRVIKTHLSTGIGIMLSHGRNIRVSRNTLAGHAQAFYIDSSVAEIGMRRYITHNTIAYNNTAFHFHAAIKNNTIRDNDILRNLEDVVKDIPGSKRYANDIACNYWDRYQGFDRDGDGLGDTPYQILIYADRLWQFDHHLKFFYATPLLSIIDFIERLAPFSEPVLLMEDAKPRMRREAPKRGSLCEKRKGREHPRPHESPFSSSSPHCRTP